jgi:hypothetical protein
MCKERRWKNYDRCDMKYLSIHSTMDSSMKFHSQFTLKHGENILKKLQKEYLLILPMLRPTVFRLKAFGHERMWMYMALQINERNIFIKLPQ